MATVLDPTVQFHQENNQNNPNIYQDIVSF